MKYLILIVLALSNLSFAQSSSSSRLVIVGGTSTASKSSIKSSAASSVKSSVRSSISASSVSSAINVEDTLEIAFSWQAPTKREDGTPLAIEDNGVLVPDIGCYEIRYKRADEAEFTKSVVLPASARNYKLKGLPITAHDVQIAACTKSGAYSQFVNALVSAPEKITTLKTKAEIRTLKVGD